MTEDPKRLAVIRNMRQAASEGRLNDKVMVDDPNPSREELDAMLDEFSRSYLSTGYKAARSVARSIATVGTAVVNRDTRIVGIENARSVEGAAIVTSNHFSPTDNSVVRTLVRALGQPYLPIVSNEENLAMTGIVGFLMHYADIIPLSSNAGYQAHKFEPMLKGFMDEGIKVLLYPEQEMWLNYRKPRPCKRGAYFYAARLGVPVVSCFVEIRETDRGGLRYIMHVLEPLYPKPELTVRENSIWMCEADYSQKVAAYERAYGKKLDYTFEDDDVAGA